MANWQELFKPWILERGQEYFEYGQVVELEEDGSVVQAEVSGSQAYQVEIRHSGKRVISMSCDCPYADRGQNQAGGRRIWNRSSATTRITGDG